ncbi:MAG: 2-oxoacid:acceptor oxidoreductase family protein [Anaerolineaceae bacterium]
MKKEIRISGFGGQGVALAGMILGKAATLYENIEAVMTQNYGPEARGGASSADVIVSDTEIAYPFIQEADILVALSQQAYLKYRPLSKKDAMVLIDQDLVTPNKGDKVLAIPSQKLAEGLGRRIVTNIVMLGFLTAVTGLVKRENMEKALESSMKASIVPLNLKAFATGFEYATAKEGKA